MSLETGPEILQKTWHATGLILLILLISISANAIGGSGGAAGSAGEPPKEISASEILDKIEMGQPVEYNYVIVKGDLTLNKLDLPVIRIMRRVQHSHQEYQNATAISSPISMTNCEIEGNVSFNNAIFGNLVDFKNTKFKGYTDFTYSIFNRSVDFSGSNFSKIVYFSVSIFDNDSDFSYSKFNEDVSFGPSDHCDYTSELCWFIPSGWCSSFNGNAYFTGSEFGGYADFRNSRFNSSANFMESRFFKIADFINSDFSNTSDFSGSEFKGDAYFSNSNFREFADFSLESSAKGDRNLGDAISILDKQIYYNKFNGDAHFEDSKFNSSASFIGSQFIGTANFKGVQFSQGVDFAGSEFKGTSNFKGSVFWEYLNVTRSTFSRLDIYWPHSTRLICEDGPTYLALIKNFRDLEKYEIADEIYYQYRYWRQNKKTWLDASKYIDILGLITCGYGVKVGHTILSAIIIFIVFGCIYSFLVLKKCYNLQTIAESFLFSLIILLSAPGELHPLGVDTYRKYANNIKYWPVLERLIGWGLMLLLINTLSRVMIRY